MIIALLAAATSAAQPSAFTAPDWLTKPNAEQLRAVFPVAALKAKISGAAKITCVVNVHGLLENCKVLEETPEGMGFGGAALLLTPNFLMKPATRDGVPIPGTVNIPINFRSGGPIQAMDTRLPYTETGAGTVGIMHPVWRAAPSFTDQGKAYPPTGTGLTGHVVFRCTVAKDDALRDCETLSEDPRGKGFERAAKTLIPLFRLARDPNAPATREEMYVSLPIRLVDPAGDDFRLRKIGNPTWTVALDPEKVAQVFPEAAAAKGVKTGRGVTSCAVGADGSLTDCTALPGQPDGLGFSQAAVVIASVMRMNIWTEEGGPVDGAHIQLPIRFNLAAGAPAAETTPSR